MIFSFKQGKGLTLDQAMATEWLETNALGGYASSSILGNTRKYHGLLIASLTNLPSKYVLLSAIEDCIIVDEQKHYLTAHHYPNYLQDGSFECLQEFILDTHPIYKFQFDGFALTKEILMLHKENSVLIKYQVKAPNQKLKFLIRPLFACRDFHELTKENSSLNLEGSTCQQGIKFNCYVNMPSLFIQTDKGFPWQTELLWYRNFIYLQERERGYPFTEDLFTPFKLECILENEEEFIVAFGVDVQQTNLKEKWNHEIIRRQKLNQSLSGSELQKQLKKTGRSFINEVDEYYGITAGYHWFFEWGRDAMISLPGLTLYSGLEEICFKVLKKFAGQEKDGLIPNFLGATKAQNAYNSVDASLWLVWAVQQYYLKTKDLKGIKKDLWPVLCAIFKAYSNGTSYNIKMQSDGLLYAGDVKTNLTWMDAAIHNQAITPRYGLQVEVNALWFNALCFMRAIAAMMLDPIRTELDKIIVEIKKSFITTFWNKELEYLYDFVNEREKNTLLRPNQIFAIALPYSVLPKNIALKILRKVRKHLLTSYGLRTLAPKASEYTGIYAGNVCQRDVAYHNGTVWPWLLGHFGEALLIAMDKEQAKEILQPCLDALTKHLWEAGIGTISEIFSGNSPHQPNGCISQAWSVAEILRLTYLLNAD